MASALSKKQEVAILNHMFGKVELVKPTAYWLALCTSEPTREQESKTLVEATYTGYVRLEVKPSEMSAAAEGAGAAASFIQNSGTLTFPACTAGSSKIKWVAIVMAALPATTANVIGWGELQAELEVTTTNTPLRFEPNELKITAF